MTCAKVCNLTDFIFSQSNHLMPWVYLATFDKSLSNGLMQAIVALIAFRMIVSFLASLSIYFGLKYEFKKILKHLGTDIKEAKTIR